MKPSIIASTGTALVNSFKYEMLNQFSLLSTDVCKELRESINVRHIEYQKQRLELASAYIDIMIDYFRETNELDDNFFTVDEFNDIIKHLNKIFDSFWWIEIKE